jgi:uncharacterized DUF497 family protein
MIDFSLIEGFDWDSGNSGKSLAKHGLSDGEAELVFFNDPLVVEDPRHSAREARFHAIGEAGDARLLHVTFTLRSAGKLIRVISARPANQKERAIYGKKT